jgi:hypothetical protein
MQAFGSIWLDENMSRDDLDRYWCVDETRDPATTL